MTKTIIIASAIASIVGFGVTSKVVASPTAPASCCCNASGKGSSGQTGGMRKDPNGGVECDTNGVDGLRAGASCTCHDLSGNVVDCMPCDVIFGTNPPRTIP